MKQAASKNTEKDKASTREEILQSMLASFKLEGIHIPADAAKAILKKVEVNLGK